MSGLPLSRPETLGFDPRRLQRIHDLLQQWTEAGTIPAVGLALGRKGLMLEPILLGRHQPDGQAPLRKDALFLTVSITKPITVTAVMLLVERGLLTLEDKVAHFVPRFAARDKGGIEVRHLMTHTSGLPDMVADNTKLRAGHKPFAAFVEAICDEPLLFAPGTKVSYQSMGTAMLGEIVHQVTGTALPQFLKKEIFEPLGMTDTSLGWDQTKKERIAAVRISPESAQTDWHWNSPYWFGFGAPWGGMITSPTDLARFCQMMLNGGKLGEVRLLSPATVRAMTSNQLAALPAVPEEERRCRPWGLGWRLNWPGHSANFGDLLGARTYGHWGATGTLVWMDPDAESFLVLFTTQPQEPEGRFLSRISNLVAAALVEPW